MVHPDPDQLVNQDVYTSDDTRIGPVEQVYDDVESGLPAWIAVQTSVTGGDSTLVPLRQTRVADDGTVVLDVDYDTVAKAPAHDPDEALTASEERSYYEHYGLEYADTGSLRLRVRPAVTETETETEVYPTDRVVERDVVVEETEGRRR